MMHFVLALIPDCITRLHHQTTYRACITSLVCQLELSHTSIIFVFYLYVRCKVTSGYKSCNKYQHVKTVTAISVYNW